MSATIYDVAKEAGVGIGTVSRFLNNSSQISEKSKRKVLAAIKALNYQPHTAAQNLARRRTNTIGCIIPFFASYFFVELLRGVQKKIMGCKNDLILYSVDFDLKKEIFLKRVLKERRIDGLLLVSLEIPDEYVEKFVSQKFPIVLVDSFHPGLDFIKVDNVEGAHIATNHLIELGYKKIAMIDGQLKSVPARLRLDGFKKALKEHRCPFDNRYFVTCDFADEADGFNKEAGYGAMQQLLDLGEDKPKAVLISSDIQAIGAMKAIKERGLKIPQDIAVVGFDDIELASHVGLTTMRQPIISMGELAVERLMKKISGEEDGTKFQLRFSPQLIVRESCGAKLVRSH
ncbi:MAG: LacI family DNA-binding transcriptional regulator [bacterium]